jgi:hypothetical protein
MLHRRMPGARDKWWPPRFEEVQGVLELEPLEFEHVAEPAVVSKATCAPRRSITALVATVVP